MTTFGTSGNDFFAGNSGFDDYLALDGDDTIFGNEGGDNLNGNQNNDVVVGGPGNDTARGGQDNDQVFGNEGDDLLFGDRGSDTIVAGEGNDTVLGGNGINVTDADNENDLIFGNTGNDVLFGDRGADTIYGGQDNDTIYGGQENDEIFGDLGDDWLYGDKGSDSLTGGDGSDRFTLGNGIGGPTLDDADWFLDFVSGQDTLQLLGDLTFDQLNIFQGTGDFANHTIIQQNVTGEFLAILRDVDATTITGQPASPPAPPPPPAVTDPNTFPSVPPPPDVTPGDPPPVVPPPPPPPGTISLAQGITPQEAGPVAGTFVLSRGGETTQALTVNYTVAGTATAGTDYTELSGTATFGVGESQAIIEVPTLDDDEIDPGETIEVTVTAPTGLTIAGDATQTLTILDDESPSLSIVTATQGDETGPANATFTVTRTGDTTAELVVPYTLGGTATAVTDYADPGAGSVTIPAGATEATITLNVVDDTDIDPDETVVVNLNPVNGFNFTESTATATITDNEQPTISIAPTTNPAEPGTAGTFTLTRTGDVSGTLDVNYTIAGTALAGAAAGVGIDYQNLTGTASFAAGSNTTTISVTPFDDTEIDPGETVEVTLAAPAGFTIAGEATAALTIADDEQPTVSIAPAVTPLEKDPVTPGAGNPVNGTFILTRTGNLSQELTVNYTAAGTAVGGATAGPGIDYDNTATGLAAAGTVTFAAGQANATLSVPTFDDTDIDPNETVDVTITAPANYIIDPAGSATASLTIVDDETPTVSIAAGTTPDEVGPVNGTFIVTLNTPAPAAGLNISYTVGGTAVGGIDYDNTATGLPATGTVNVAGGATTATITAPIIDDTDLDPNETIQVTIAAPAGYQVGTGTADLTILDDETNTVEVTAFTDGNESGPADGTFTLTRTGNTANLLVVNYTLGGTAISGTDYTDLGAGVANFAAGADTTTVTITPIDDALGEGVETVALNLAAGAGYNVGATSTQTLSINDNDGTTGADNITGAGDDGVLAGGDGDDNITAGNNAGVGDILVGGQGNDVLTGGAGNDRFRYNATTEGTDTINNFTVGDDSIEVAAGAFGGFPLGALPVANFVTGAAATAAAPQFIYNAGALSFDADGTGAGAAVLLANLTGAPAITEAQIQVI
ncbi:MAG: hypothetical protein D6680_22120 [Cyanobacteria bacterium J007]|nr:MAG: hypothetical protein D6680_22120 [Cyanobacteria bacterium J007]